MLNSVSTALFRYWKIFGIMTLPLVSQVVEALLAANLRRIFSLSMMEGDGAIDAYLKIIK